MPSKKMKHQRTALLLVFLILCSCAPTFASQQSSPETEFKIIILRENWHALKIGYQAEHAQAVLRSVDSSHPLFVITKEQIEKYDWDLQTITLTSAATIELGKALSTLGKNSIEIEKLNNLKASLGWGNPVESALYIHPFIVQVGSQFKYGGIFLDAPSQMAINFPVARTTLSDGKVVFALLPTHIPFVMLDPVDGSGHLRQAVIAQEAKSDIQQLDFFEEWSNGLATSPTSIKYRAILRDEDIRVIFEK